MEMRVECRAPSECGLAEIKAFCRFVYQGGEVDKKGLQDRIKRAATLVFLYAGDDLAGIAAVKRPVPAYKRRVFEKAGFPDAASGFSMELGWVYIEPWHRVKKLSRQLVDAAIDSVRGEALFATSRSDNGAMHATLARFGFVMAGSPYRSTCVLGFLAIIDFPSELNSSSSSL